MPFKKGQKKKGGRAKGVPNKRSEQWEKFVDYCLVSGLSKFEEEIKKLKGKDYVMAFTNLLEFHKPKQQRMQIEAKVQNKTYTINKRIITKNDKS